MRELVVGVGEGGVSCDPDTALVTYALGSCVAVMLHDPVARVAGMVHYLLPESAEFDEGFSPQPWKFADTGIASLLSAAAEHGAHKHRLMIYAAGGAEVMNDSSIFNIGRRNCVALRKTLGRFGLFPHAEETGGSLIRTVRIEVHSGRVWLHSSDGEQREMKPHLRDSSLRSKNCLRCSTS